MPQAPRPFSSPTLIDLNARQQALKASAPPTPKPPPDTSPTTALIKLGEHAFEMDKDSNIRPYGDKPTLEQQTMAESVREMVKQGIGHSASYQPLAGSNLYHGIYTIDPQKWLQQLLDTHQPDFTPDDIQPHPTMPGAWIFRNPNNGAYEIYK